MAVPFPGRAGLGSQRDHPLSGEGLGEAVGVSLGNDEMRVMEKPVHRRGGEGLRHDGVEARGVDKVRRSLNLERAYLQGRFGAVPELDQFTLRRALGLEPSDA